MREHKPDRSCCNPVRVTLGRDLYNRMRCHPYYSTDDYARALAQWEGQEVTAVHSFEGAYTIEAPDGRLYHLPALYAAPGELPNG